MPRAFKIDEVKEIFSESGCKLLSSSYTNRNDIMHFECSCGNVDDVKFYLFLQGTRCKECCSKNKSKAHRFGYDFVKEFFEINGCTLLEKTYINSSQKLMYICSCGNRSTITFRKFKGGQRCRKCCGTDKLNIDEARKRFAESGFTLLENQYTNAKTKMKYLCKCGRTSECSITNLSRHGGCVHCRSKKMPASKQQKYVADLINGEFNYPYDKLILDIAFPEIKVYIECDFSGHWLSVQFGQFTEKEFEEREKRRRTFMTLQGWTEIRLISRKDWLLEDNALKELIKRTIKIATTVEMNLAIDLDKGIVFELDTNIKISTVKKSRRWRL